MQRSKRHKRKAAASGDNRQRRYMTLGTLFLCLLFLVSSVLTSLAWYDFTQTKTNIFRGTAENVTVVLHKVEKDANGVIRANPVMPVMDAEFQLYRIEDDGTETLLPGGPWYTDVSGKIIFDGRDDNHPKLDSGKYVFIETSPSFGYTYDKDDNGNDITRYEFEVTEEDALNNRIMTVSAYNRRGSGTLAIKKTVVGNVPSDDKFTFTITFSDNGTYSYSVNGSDKISISSGASFELKHGQTALFEDIPIGVQYHVAEAPHLNYVVSSTGHQGNITEAGSVASFVNTYRPSETGSLTVTKEVTGEGADVNQSFDFTAVINGEITKFSLKSGEKKTFSDLPIGAEYTVTESGELAEGYIPTVKHYTGTIMGKEELILPFVNVFDSKKLSGDLIVVKKVIGDNADPNKVFTFEITFEGAGAPASPQTFTLKDGESKTFTGIPAGVVYTVRETDASGYLPEVSEVTGVIASEKSAVVTIRNRVPSETVELSVEKVLVGEYPKADANKAFEFTLLINGEKLEFTLKKDETKVFAVPQGAIYEIIEKDYFSDGYDQSISNGFGTVTDKDIQVVVTNTFIGDPVVDIEGEKKWELNGNTNIKLPDSITVRLKNGELVVIEKVVKPDASGNWKYSFTVPKYDANNREIKYTIEELPLSGFVPSYSEYNITNTYVAPVEADPPVVTKAVQGENAPDTKFAFVMKGQDGAPMPEGAVGNTKTIYITGSGEVEFGNIHFTMPGVYTYNIYETNGGEAGWTYDSAKYTIVFTVTEANGKLSVSRQTIERDGEAVDTVQFTNSYTKPPASTVTVEGHKAWEHGNNPEANQPKNIVVYVYADGKLAVQWQVSEQDNWSYSFELPKFAEDGHEIVYTIDEADVPNYKKSIDGYNILNTYTGASDDTVRPSEPGGTTDTGDHVPFVPWLVLMLVSGTMLIILFCLRRKKRKSTKDR